MDRYDGKHIDHTEQQLALSLRRHPLPEQIPAPPESSCTLEFELKDRKDLGSLLPLASSSRCSDCTTKYEREAQLMMLCEEERGSSNIGHESDSPLSCSSSVEPPSNSTAVVVVNSPSVQLPLWLRKALPSENTSDVSASTTPSPAEVNHLMSFALYMHIVHRDCRSKAISVCSFYMVLVILALS
jgi:hypothetical protein